MGSVTRRRPDTSTDRPGIAGDFFRGGFAIASRAAAMSDSKNKRAATSPGYGPEPKRLAPLEVDAMTAVEDEMTAVDQKVVLPDVVDGRVPMKLEAQPVEAPARIDAPASAPQKAGEAPRSRRGQVPAVDIDLVYERRSAPLPDQPWVFLEIWTRNTIYALDARLVCIDVVDQVTKRSHGDHPLRGARLVGGQAREGEAMELSHPFPRPGAEAVFEQMQGRHVRFSQTSTVTRVVMRLRVLTVTPEQLLPTWEEVTGSHKIAK